jgi:hypothetical protein
MTCFIFIVYFNHVINVFFYVSGTDDANDV